MIIKYQIGEQNGNKKAKAAKGEAGEKGRNKIATVTKAAATAVGPNHTMDVDEQKEKHFYKSHTKYNKTPEVCSKPESKD